MKVIYSSFCSLFRCCFVCKSGYFHRQCYTYSLPFGFTTYGITTHNAATHERQKFLFSFFVVVGVKSSQVDSSRFESIRNVSSRFMSIGWSVHPASVSASMCEQMTNSLIYEPKQYSKMHKKFHPHSMNRMKMEKKKRTTYTVCVLDWLIQPTLFLFRIPFPFRRTTTKKDVYGVTHLR